MILKDTVQVSTVIYKIQADKSCLLRIPEVKTWGSGTERLMSCRRFWEGSRIVKRIDRILKNKKVPWLQRLLE